jgi:hypothetical protein
MGTVAPLEESSGSEFEASGAGKRTGLLGLTTGALAVLAC